MENKNIVMLRHHPMNVKFTNTFYVKQVEDDLSDYVIIDVTSRCVRNKEFMSEHPTFAKDLSPFFIGPVVGPDGVKCNIFELFWQCGKVYPCHDNNGKPNAEFFEWRNKYFSMKVCDKSVMRHPCYELGYDHRDVLYYPYYDKDKNEYIPINYIDSRKKVYFKEYAKLIYSTESFKYMKELVENGKKIALVDFDGYNYSYPAALSQKYSAYVNKCKKNGVPPTISEDDFLKINSMKKVIECPFMSAGHGFVIKALLQGDIEVVNGEVIDHVGILD